MKAQALKKKKVSARSLRAVILNRGFRWARSV
jgi:hypothetical protein